MSRESECGYSAPHARGMLRMDCGLFSVWWTSRDAGWTALRETPCALEGGAGAAAGGLRRANGGQLVSAKRQGHFK